MELSGAVKKIMKISVLGRNGILLLGAAAIFVLFAAIVVFEVWFWYAYVWAEREVPFPSAEKITAEKELDKALGFFEERKNKFNEILISP